MKKKRAIILTGQTGQGHFSMAQAYRYWLEQWGYQSEIYDVLPRISEKATSWIHRVPKIYKLLFKISNRPFLAQAMIEPLVPEIEKKLNQVIPNYMEADLIISTHALIRPRGSTFVKVMLLLDPIAHATYFTSPQPDYYFALWPQATADAIKFGVNLNQLIYTLPLARPAFYEMGEKILQGNIKTSLREKLGVEQNCLLILVMAGSGLIKRSKAYIKHLRIAFKDDNVVFVFLCGKNQSFQKEMKESYGDDPMFRFLNWLSEEEMAEWMAVADFGLAFSLAQMSVEAGLVGLPLFIFRLIGGQEERYKNVVGDKGVGMHIAGKPKNQVASLRALLKRSREPFAKNLISWQKELLSGPTEVKKALEQIVAPKSQEPQNP